MSEVIQDCAIKLFGKTIAFFPDKIVSDITVPEQTQCSSSTSSSQDSKEASGGEFTGSTKHEYDSINPTEEILTEAATSSEISDDLNTPAPEEKHSSSPSDSSASQEKTLKKPEKILPCPRCNSMETKFCYYNNYNVNQPRHFCKNCQRYWTSGGTTRNVPVGSGRRKNKNAAVPNYHHIMMSDAPQAARNGIHLPSLKLNGLLIFGSDKRSQNCVPNEFYDHSSRCSSATMRPPAFGQSGFPVTFYPATPHWVSSISCSGMSTSSPSSCTLGKHSREGTMIKPSNLGKENLSEKISSERSVLIPRTLRIDDPNEAAKSSIWSTLGIKNERTGSINQTGLFRTFESKGDRLSGIDNAIMVLQANPAALSRSRNFHESV